MSLCLGGSVTLTSNSPFDYPNIDPAFLSTDFDINASVEAVKYTTSILSLSPFSGYVSSGFNLTSDAAIKSFIRNAATTIKHPLATAKVSKVNDTNGVVGPDLRVKGVKNLRVVDGSVLVSLAIS